MTEFSFSDMIIRHDRGADDKSTLRAAGHGSRIWTESRQGKGDSAEVAKGLSALCGRAVGEYPTDCRFLKKQGKRSAVMDS